MLDTIMVSRHHPDGLPGGERRCGEKVLKQARHRKERTYPELSGAGGRALLVALAATVGGRCSLGDGLRERPRPYQVITSSRTCEAAGLVASEARLLLCPSFREARYAL